MLIQGLLVGAIGGIFAYTCKIVYEANKSDDEVIEIENIVKYKYLPIEECESEKIDLNKIKYTFTEGEKEGLKVCIGYNMNKEKEIIDILDGHILIGGMTGGGKSNLLNVIITSLMKTYTEREVFFLGWDGAESDIYYFRKYKNFKKVRTDNKGFLDIVEFLDNKMKERSKILDECNCRNVINYNKKYDKKMSYIVVIVDELVQLSVDSKCKTELHRIMSKCRKYGIYFILGGQDATKDTIGKCKMNCPQVIGFKTFDETDSNTLMGKNQDLQDITVTGRCKIKNKNGIREVQIMYIDEDEMEVILKPYLRE